VFDTPAKGASYLHSPEEPTVPKAFAAFTRKSIHLVFNLNKQENNKAWEAVLENNFHLLYVEMSSLPISVSSMDMTTYIDT
jgi:hypothetical protein